MIYFDSCIAIYYLEQHPRWHDAVKRIVAGAAPGSICISSLVKAECLVKPMRTGNLPLQSKYFLFFAAIKSLEMPDDVYIAAARLRAQFNLKLPDALHLACAQRHGCEALWTNDARLDAAAGGMARVLT